MSLSVDALLKLRDALSNPIVCKLLGHLPTINSATLWLASDPDTLPYITPRLLAEVADAQDQIVHPHIYRFLCDTLRMAEQLCDKSVPTRYLSIARLLEVHDKLSARIEKVLDDGFGGKQTWEDLPRKFPEPPLKGTADIVPITNVLELVKEGRSMHNCVSAYSWKVAYGETYIYRVSKPIRATVAIKREGMRWKLAEVSGVCNEIISETHIKRIKRGLFGVEA